MIPVACGVLRNARGEALIAQRPVGKIAAGKWEFPGGKIEAGESAREALVRELGEELGIAVTQARPLIRLRHDYSDRTVVLDTWLIDGWQGEPQSREQQGLAWCRPERLHEYDLLAADGPIVSALRLPSTYVFTPPEIGEAQLLHSLARLPSGALLRLRLPALESAAYERLARKVLDESAALRLGVMLDREPQQALDLGAAGWHGSAANIAARVARPLPKGLWVAGSAHDAAQLQHLRQLQVDFAVLGSVQATPSHPGAATLGWPGFHALVAECGLPVYAIGGLMPKHQAEAHAHYAQGVAGISAYWVR